MASQRYLIVNTTLNEYLDPAAFGDSPTLDAASVGAVSFTWLALRKLLVDTTRRLPDKPLPLISWAGSRVCVVIVPDEDDPERDFYDRAMSDVNDISAAALCMLDDDPDVSPWLDKFNRTYVVREARRALAAGPKAQPRQTGLAAPGQPEVETPTDPSAAGGDDSVKG